MAIYEPRLQAGRPGGVLPEILGGEPADADADLRALAEVVSNAGPPRATRKTEVEIP